MSSGKYLFTSESVSMGHPDKLADQISDGILDAIFAQERVREHSANAPLTQQYLLEHLVNGLLNVVDDGLAA